MSFPRSFSELRERTLGHAVPPAPVLRGIAKVNWGIVGPATGSGA